MKHIRELDGLRGVAVLLVVLYHCTHLGRDAAIDDLLFRATRGWDTGVDIFFVLSGFLITGILIHSRGQDHYFYNFYIKRLLRIFPLYYVIVAIAVFAPILFPILQQNDIPILPYWGLPYWLFLQNIWGVDGHPILVVTWSLAHEEQFYLLWPLVVSALPLRSISKACLGLIVVGVLTRAGLMFDVTDSVLFALLARVDLLALGGLVACWYMAGRNKNSDEAKSLVRQLTWISIAVIALLIWQAEGPWGPWFDTFGKVAVGTLTAAVIVAATSGLTNGLLHRTLRGRFLTSWGKYSYAIYLMNAPLDAILRRVIDIETFFFPILGTEIPMQLVYWAIICSICWCAGWLSWRVLEVHFLNLKPRLTRSSGALAAAE